MANYSQMTHAQLVALCSKQKRIIDSADDPTWIRVRKTYIKRIEAQNEALRKQMECHDTNCMCKVCFENDELKEKLSDAEEKLSNAEYDLDSLKTDLKPLDDMMYENKINEYEDVVEHVAYLETSVQTTANYWESKYENEVDTNKMLMEAIEAQTEHTEKSTD